MDIQDKANLGEGMWRAWAGFLGVLAIFLGIDYYNYHLLMAGDIEANWLNFSWASLDTAKYDRPGMLKYSGNLTWWEHASLLAPICAAFFGGFFGFLRHKKIEAKKEIAEIERALESKKKRP